ncbi:cupin domain-containing protein [Arenimonas sp.]|uniref:JmjC domain-containing protein n=1 Tax=Arenimonas sp. TaxID=1872635 RepID=UPI001E328142
MAKKTSPQLPIEVTGTPKHPLGMPAEVFLRDYWQKRPLLIRGAFPGFVSPITPEDLAGLACEESALSRVVLHDRKRDRWELRTGPFDEAMFPDMPRQDWTLLVQDVDKWDMDVRDLLHRFRFLPAWRVDDVMVSFAAPGGSVGAHVDQYDVFLIQGLGHRRWQIDTNPDAPKAFRPDVELKLLSEFTPDHDWVLAPGDILYLPPGVPHHGVAEDACLTLSVGMRAPSVAELMVDLAEELAAATPEEARYADPDLALPADPFEIDEAAFGRVRQALSRLQDLDETALRRWFGRFITQYRSAGEIARPARPPALAALTSALDEGALLLRHPHARHAWARDGRKACLHANGLSLPMGVASARCLAGAERLDAAAVAGLDAAGREALVSLVAAGHYQLVKPKRRR